MIIQADVKGLEVATAAFLSQDQVLLAELWNKVDIHEVNQDTFNLPDRLIAKTLKFRILYGGSGYAFSKDPEFKDVSTSAKYWDDVIERYYNKYKGIRLWHKSLVYEASTTGQIVCPTGRFFKFNKTPFGEWPVTQIKNYPVQGTGADLVSIARIEFYRLIKEKQIECLPVATVHDSIVVDCPFSSRDLVGRALDQSIRSIPKLFGERFGTVFNVPIYAEITAGPNFADLNEELTYE